MIRLGLLMLATLVGLYVVLVTYGDGDLRATRRPTSIVTAAQDAGAPADPAPADPLPAAAPAAIIPAASQTPAQVERFPGPALEPSPEHAGRVPAAASQDVADAGTLFVTATRLNVRGGPGPENAVVTALDRGSPVQPLGPTGAEWVRIRAPGGQEGFVASQFLSPDAP